MKICYINILFFNFIYIFFTQMKSFYLLYTEAFQTPCSTPPGSEASVSSDDIANTSLDNMFDRNGSISELALHHKLYDRYTNMNSINFYMDS